MSVVFPASGWEMIAKVRRREISRAEAAGTVLVEAEVVKGRKRVAPPSSPRPSGLGRGRVEEQLPINWANCHALKGRGLEVGPELTTISQTGNWFTLFSPAQMV